MTFYTVFVMRWDKIEYVAYAAQVGVRALFEDEAAANELARALRKQKIKCRVACVRVEEVRK